jgi:hypothetical protein
MKHNELEAYLSKLEKSLGPIAVSEKAEIITEIKSHVLDAADNDQNTTILNILASLGEPEQVANRYLLERGLSPQKPPKHPTIKWLVIGFLGTGGLITLFIFIMVWKFTPFIKVDEEKGRVQILGGLIDVHDKSGNISISGLKLNGKYQHFEGVYNLDKIKTNDLVFDFTNTRSEFSINEKNQIDYRCKLDGKADIQSNNLVHFNLKNTAGSKCSFKIPAKYKIKITSNNGKILFDRIQNHLDLNMTNGKVQFKPDMTNLYQYDLSVLNGKIDHFKNSDDKDAYQVKISVVNGKISN